MITINTIVRRLRNKITNKDLLLSIPACIIYDFGICIGIWQYLKS